MLPVSDLLEVARGTRSGAALGAAAPRRFASAAGAAPVVIWNVCMHCQMTCPHCYAAAVAEPSPTDLTTEEGLRLLEEMAACGVRIVIFSGGEPLLRADLFELLARARELGISAQLSSNGLLIDEPTAERLAAVGVAYVGVSLDGVADFNDAYRGVPGASGKALAGLAAARRAGMRTGMRLTLTRRNADQLFDVMALAEAVGVDRFYVSHLVYSGRAHRITGDDLPRWQVREILHELFARAEALLERGAGLRVVTGSNDSDGPLLLRWIEARHGEQAARPVHALLLERGGNSAGERILDIDARGRVHPDQFWRQATLGDVRKDRFEEILRHPLRALLRDRAGLLQGRCGACRYRALCRGSHRERALAVYKDLWAPDPACVLEDDEIGLVEAAGNATSEGRP